jgi:hypothetical protein
MATSRKMSQIPTMQSVAPSVIKIEILATFTGPP